MSSLDAPSGERLTFAHKLLNKLSIIIGSCELVQEIAENENRPAPPCIRRLLTIRQAAEELAEDVRQHRSELDAIEVETTTAFVKKAPSKTLVRAIKSNSDPLKANG